MATTTVTLKAKVDHAKLAKMIKKAVSKIDAAKEDDRVDLFALWASLIVNECIEFQIDGMPHLPKDSK